MVLHIGKGWRFAIAPILLLVQSFVLADWQHSGIVYRFSHPLQWFPGGQNEHCQLVLYLRIKTLSMPLEALLEAFRSARMTVPIRIYCR